MRDRQPNYAARHRPRSSPAPLEHTIDFPVLVCPVAPVGEQYEPGCTVPPPEPDDPVP